MKTKLLLLPLAAIAYFVTSSMQLHAQQVIATAGGYYENDNIALSWTIGETVTETFTSENITLTQGF